MDAALYDQPRPGAPPKITGDIEAQLTLLADKMVELGYVESLSHVTVGERLKKTRSSHGGSRRGALGSHPPNMSPKWRTC
jgi:hypothetical protein